MPLSKFKQKYSYHVAAKIQTEIQMHTMTKTKFIMSSSAFLLGLSGILLIFLPQEIATYLGIGANLSSTLLFQLIGSLYFGFAFLNWMSRSAILGGIYGRPLIVGNLSHFLIMALSLIKVVFRINQFQTTIIILTLIYAFYAVSFGLIMKTNPKMNNE